MIRATIFLCFLAICALSAPVPNDERPIEQLVKSLEPLTREESNILMEMAKDHKDGQTPEDFMLTIKTKSPSIYKKLTKVRTVLEETYNLLHVEARAYFKNVISGTLAFFKAKSNRDDESQSKIGKKLRSEYENLSEEAKASFEKQLSTINSAVNSLISEV